MIKKLLRQRGFSLTELVISMGLVGGLAVVSMKVMDNSSKASKKSSGSSDLRSIRAGIIANLQHPDSFDRTVKHFINKTTFACLRGEGADEDCRSASGEFKIYRLTNRDTVVENQYVSFSSSTAGFSATGLKCNDFNHAVGQGSDSCPYKYVASWTAICPEIAKVQGKNSIETKCRNPLFNVTVKLLFNPKNPKKFPPLSSKQDINIILAQAGSDQNMLCSMTGNGYFDSTTNTCVSLRSGSANCANSCPAGSNSFVKGFYEDGSLNCECTPVPSLVCPNNQVLLGVQDDGSLNCGNALIAGLQYSGSINNTPETYTAYLRKKLQDANAATNAAKTVQQQAQTQLTAAQSTYDAAEVAAKSAQEKVDAAKAAAGGTPTAAQQAALDAAIAAYNQAMRDLQIARAELQRASDELLKAQLAEAAAQKKLDDFLASLP